MATDRYSTWGECLRFHRMKLGLTLREFCARNKLDPGNVSKLERGVLAPPQRSLQEYASAVKLEPETPEWVEFFDLAAAQSGRISSEVMADEELRARLPVLLRTLHDRRLTAEELDRLIERIRTE